MQNNSNILYKIYSSYGSKYVLCVQRIPMREFIIAALFETELEAEEWFHWLFR